MKVLATTILLFLILFDSNAQCIESSFRFSPKDVIDHPNPLIVVSAHSATLHFIKFYLLDQDDEIIDLELSSTNKLSRSSQFVFKPVKALKDQVLYRAGWETIVNEISPEIANWISKQDINVIWKTDFSSKTISKDKSIEFSYLRPYYNCTSEGVESYAIFNVNYEKKFWQWIQVHAIENNSLDTISFLLPKQTWLLDEDSKQLRIGASGCGGPIRFHRDATYRLKLKFLDTGGDSLTSTDWINIQSPSDGNVFKAKFIEKSSGVPIKGLNLHSLDGDYCRKESRRQTFVTDENGTVEIIYRIPYLVLTIFNLFEPRDYVLNPTKEIEIIIKQKVLIPKVKTKKED